ncbi:MAG: ribonuclease HII [Flavobacteriia bacterium]|nr:ribonuclease HII [Flavobacteriia bacterium]
MPTLKAFFNENLREAGTDEAGRGCLAGPVVAASVVLKKNFYHPFLNDSKQLSEKKRNELRKVIENEALDWKVVRVEAEKIDEINILNASILAMQQATLLLKVKPELVIVDGNRFHPFEIPHTCIIKGDTLFQSIAAASILAKTHRDELMLELHELHPQYSWDKNKGYPSKMHKEAIKKYGLTAFHRLTFKHN